MPNTKQSYRTLALTQRASITATQQQEATRLIYSQLDALVVTLAGHHPRPIIMIYLAIAGSSEIDLLPWAIRQNCALAVPYLIRGNVGMTATQFDPHTAELIRGPFKVPQPAEYLMIDPLLIDLVIAPTLVVDTALNRIGYGKGYYDRFLIGCRPDIPIIGVGYWQPQDLITDVDPWDYPLMAYAHADLKLS